MMASPKVTLDYEGLKKQASVILKQKADFDTLIKNVKTTTQNLNQVWDDAAAKNFTEKVNAMDKTFKQFSEALKGLGDHMNNVSDKYKELSQAVIKAQSGF